MIYILLKLNRSLLILGAMLLLLACGNKDGYTELEEGVSYKMIYVSDDESYPTVGQYISYRIEITDEKNKTLYRTNKIGIDKDDYFLYTRSRSKFLNDNINAFKQGDSVSLKVTPAVFTKQFSEIKIDSAANFVLVNLKIRHVEDKDVRKNRLDSTRNYAKLKEETILSDYLDNRDDFKEWNGLYLRTVKKGVKPVINDHLKLEYKAYFLNGKLFDETTDKSEVKYSYGEIAQVIKGIGMVVSKLGINSKSEIIIPSALAFGESGSIESFIPPYTSVRYELSVLEDTTVMKYD